MYDRSFGIASGGGPNPSGFTAILWAWSFCNEAEEGPGFSDPSGNLVFVDATAKCAHRRRSTLRAQHPQEAPLEKIYYNLRRSYTLYEMHMNLEGFTGRFMLLTGCTGSGHIGVPHRFAAGGLA